MFNRARFELERIYKKLGYLDEPVDWNNKEQQKYYIGYDIVLKKFVRYSTTTIVFDISDVVYCTNLQPSDVDKVIEMLGDFAQWLSKTPTT